jgi:hypothetical protein
MLKVDPPGIREGQKQDGDGMRQCLVWVKRVGFVMSAVCPV